MNHTVIHLFEIIVAASLINNIVLTRFLGLSTFFGSGKSLPATIGTSIIFTVTMCLSAALSWLSLAFIIHPLNLGYLKLVIFISIIAVLVPVIETTLKKISPTFYRTIGFFPALITTNCVILAIPLITTESNFTFPETMAFALGSGLGFALVLLIIESLQDRLELADIPRPLQGLPILFIVAGMIALAFTGFSGLVKP